jgi:hypothetical protein
MFLQSKDDSLLLQIGGLIHAILLYDPPETLKKLIPALYG